MVRRGRLGTAIRGPAKAIGCHAPEFRVPDGDGFVTLGVVGGLNSKGKVSTCYASQNDEELTKVMYEETASYSSSSVVKSAGSTKE